MSEQVSKLGFSQGADQEHDPSSALVGSNEESQQPQHSVAKQNMYSETNNNNYGQMSQQTFYEAPSGVSWSHTPYREGVVLSPVSQMASVSQMAFSPPMSAVQLPEGALLSPKPASLDQIREKLQVYVSRNATDPTYSANQQMLFSPTATTNQMFSPPMGFLTPLLGSPNVVIPQPFFVTTQVPQSGIEGLPPRAVPQSPENNAMVPSWCFPPDPFASGLFSPHGTVWHSTPQGGAPAHFVKPQPVSPPNGPNPDPDIRQISTHHPDSIDNIKDVVCLGRLQATARSVMEMALQSFTQSDEPNPEIKAAEVLYMAQLMIQSSFPALAREMPAFMPNNQRNSTMMLAHPDEFKNPSSFLKVYGDPLCYRSTNLLPRKGRCGNWPCHQCHNINFPRRFRCNKCGTSRDAEGDRIVAEYTHQVFNRKLPQLRSVPGSLQFPMHLPNFRKEEREPTGSRTAPARNREVSQDVNNTRPAASETSRYVPPTASPSKRTDTRKQPNPQNHQTGLPDQSPDPLESNNSVGL
eukprot:GHVP01048644.1.p1 GENE.GHVP01048644.1~~GHVP01048644.1.p1  ORF type:complete len:523 (+),score=65.63 GHVP01048644.1:72-1640(+)